MQYEDIGCLRVSIYTVIFSKVFERDICSTTKSCACVPNRAILLNAS
jgi:hypothetical protein